MRDEAMTALYDGERIRRQNWDDDYYWHAHDGLVWWGRANKPGGILTMAVGDLNPAFNNWEIVPDEPSGVDAWKAAVSARLDILGEAYDDLREIVNTSIGDGEWALKGKLDG